MGDKTGIGWTDATWSPVTGCREISPGCQKCYAAKMFLRLAANPKTPDYHGRIFHDVACHEDRLAMPLRWKRPRMIFVNSMSDLFHEDVPFEFIDKVFAVMALCPQHTFQILTKRPERMLEYFDESEHHVTRIVSQLRVVDPKAGCWGWPGWPLPNVWLGVSVEDQERADERIPILLECPAALHWISAEPLLGPVYLGKYLSGHAHLDWIVIGGESGPGARICNIEWIRIILAVGSASKVPMFVKQLGARAVLENARVRGVTGKGVLIEQWPEDLRVQQWPLGFEEQK